MSITRFSILSSSGILLLLSACSGRPGSDQARPSDASPQAEQTESSAVTPETTRQSDQNTLGASKDQRLATIPLPPEKIAKWVNVLKKPPVYKPEEEKNGEGVVIRHHFTVAAKEAMVQMLPPGPPEDFKPTQVYTFVQRTREGLPLPAQYEEGNPGPTFEMTRGIPASVTWLNELKNPHFLPIDPTLHWANPNGLSRPTAPFPPFPDGYPAAQSPVPYVTHVHGLEVDSRYDGAPEAWFTAKNLDGKAGPAGKFSTAVYDYPNSQPASTLWYHDHTLGITRLNVYAGLAGMYIISDPKNKLENPTGAASVLPDAEHEMPLVIQDKSFNTDGSLYYPSEGFFADDHPYWVSSFLGDTNVVNGKVWPQMEVERTRYRFRVLNAANTRFYNLSLEGGPAITVIGSDGGYLAKPTSPSSVRLAPGERADILIDFSSVEAGKTVLLRNDADGADPDTTGQVVRFKVPVSATEPKLPAPAPLPAMLDDTMPTLEELKTNVAKRTVTLVPGPAGSYLLDGQAWHNDASEKPRLGATEDWDIVNLADMDHPIHLHLVQFRIVGRKPLGESLTRYEEDWAKANPGVRPLKNPTVPVPVDSYLDGDLIGPEPAEAGWKDTVIAPYGSVTRIRVRWAPQDAPLTTAPGTNAFVGFDPSMGPGYVWHCHMLEHEDNEMMRPIILQK